MSDSVPTPGDTGAQTLEDRLARVLADVATVQRGADASLTIDFDGTRAVAQSIELAEGLEVVSLTQVLAWDLPNTEALRDDIEALSARLSFGHIKRSDRADVSSDVLLHYTFPAGTLSDMALLTLVHMVLASGADAARALTD